ncbi:uncharacterized protein LOC108200108 [Daucus carota subsp. sativus]|uniref:uncharacterized protein LOC108200108 n=1 Tax=Daucus carota subsp. sativus TaxID=79200 RepID=UPI0007EF6F0D|nr:PREDICTED: WD repeat-containing protein 43 [Daucus carota subsp. sativus]
MTSANIRDVLTSFSPALDFFAICSGDGRIKIWDTVKSQVQTEFADIGTAGSDDLIGGTKGGHRSVDYTCMKWLSLGKKKKRKLGSSLLILGTGSGDVLALDVSAGQLKWRVSDCHPGGVTSVSFPAHGSCIYTAGADGMICELDSLTGNLLRKFKASSKAISSMSVSSDGKTLATAAAQLKVFDCSDHRKIQKFSGHPAAVRCMIFSEDGKYILSSAVAERYVAAWRIDGSKKKLASFVLAMDHPAVFLDSRCIATGDNDDEGLCVLAISEIGVCYFWSGQNIDELRDCKPTKVSISTSDQHSKNNGVVPTVFAAKLQAAAKSSSGHLFAAYGSLIKPSFEKILVQPGEDIKLNSSADGILLPHGQIKKGKKGSTALTQITALDRANAEDASLPISKILDGVNGQIVAKSGKSNELVEFDDVTHCMEERLISLGILSSDSDLSSNSQFDNTLLNGINLEANMPQKKMRATISSMVPGDAYNLLKDLLAMWKTRSSTGKLVLPWIRCLLIIHSHYIVSEEPNTRLLDSLYKLTKSKGEAINSLVQLAGRLQLVTAQIDKAANNKSQSFQPLPQTDESEDEEVEEFLYGEEDEESQSSSDNED